MPESPLAREDAALDHLIVQSAVAEPGRIEAYGPHPDQVIEWYAPLASSGISPIVDPPLGGPVVFIHGGFFRPSIDRAHARSTAAALADRVGSPVVLAEYQRVSGQPDVTVHDIRGISDLLEGLGQEPSVWVGHSAGGTLVLLRALDQVRPAVPVVALAPIVDLRSGLEGDLGAGAIRDWLGERTAAKPSRYGHVNPAALAADLPERHDMVLCVHGDGDQTVPVTQSLEGGLPALTVDGAHHYDLIDPVAPAFEVVLDAVRAAMTRR